MAMMVFKSILVGDVHFYCIKKKKKEMYKHTRETSLKKENTAEIYNLTRGSGLESNKIQIMNGI